MMGFLQQYSIPFAVCGLMFLLGFWRGRQHNSIKKMSDDELIRSIEFFSSTMRKCGISLTEAARLAAEIVPKTLILKSSIERIENTPPPKPDLSYINQVERED